MPTTEKTIETLAGDFRRFFVKDQRPDGSAFWRNTDDAPESVKEMVRDAHGDHLPDDYRYAFVVEALDAISEDGDDASLEADTYTGELTAWLHSHNSRLGYCDEAMSEYGVVPAADGGTFKLLQYGQYMEKQEVLASVCDSLNRLLELEEA